VILYTSGTTGLPKGALISQRAMVARAMASPATTASAGRTASSPGRRCSTWRPPTSLATLMLGGKVFVQDGLDLPRLCAVLATERLGWLVAMPGMIEPLIDGAEAQPRPCVRCAWSARWPTWCRRSRSPN
jgi:acyl-CoA synthetase (AMP-forming)/AMP-acid ligase II